MKETKQESLDKQKGALESFLRIHGLAVLKEVSRYEGLHHELRPQVSHHNFSEIERLKEEIRGIPTKYIEDFAVYVIFPGEGIMLVGDSPEQTVDELLDKLPELKKKLQRGETSAFPGYCFTIKRRGWRVAVVERVLTHAFSPSAQSFSLFRGRLNEIVNLLEKRGYIAVGREESGYKVL